ncbi:N-acetylmuramic acid 6-phosphate etherase [Rhodoferax sp.]|uniref:N-acetylmuramic acid 6-phosphate etherase n=1 Tax=Rhodoferax sp. TaxID=50421 RepID=UPI002755B946|nr:N-acetylmuramic acid 6-phosphate etherase [Rhodoferax sp.]
MLNTETPSTLHTDLDLYETPDLVSAFVEDQVNAVNAVRAAGADIARAVDAAAARMRQGGRLIYVGAGTSGRLGVLDSVELNPTFSWPNERAVGLLAGGASAMFVAVEGAEDDTQQGARDVRAASVNALDVVLLLAASGGTPYVLGALQAARDAGALTLGFANNPNAPVTQQAEIGMTLDTGSEVISGSTRLKAGTAQKIALNTFSSALMVRLGKVYGNLMVDMKATNAKLVRRTVALTQRATGCDEASARQILQACDHHVKVAIVALRLDCDVAAARSRLAAAGDNVRRALDGAQGDA